MQDAMSILALAIVALTGLGGCASPSPTPPQSQKAVESVSKRPLLERDLAVARERLLRARRDAAQEETSSPSSVAKARGDLALAQGKLKDFGEAEAPNRLGKARLDVQDARDVLDDAREELEQLELMYKEQDLADKTREIVIRRSKRQLQRTQNRLAMQETELKTLEERTLPSERQKLVQDAEDKQRELDRATRTAESALADKKIAVLTAEGEVAKLEAELSALPKDAK